MKTGSGDFGEANKKSELRQPAPPCTALQLLAELRARIEFFPNAADFDGFWLILSIRGIPSSVLIRLREK